MTNGIYPQSMQYSQTPQAQGAPSASVGAVNIQIYNPTSNNGMSPMYPTSSFYNPQSQYMPYPYPVPQQVQTAAPSQTPTNVNASANATATAAPTPTPTPVPAPATEPEKKSEKTENKVVLTDDYIKSLENYLNNENPKIRMMGMKETMSRFKEDKTRKNDAALTALLNKALQDPAASVRFMALTTLDVGYATGNDETIGILKQIQNQGDQQYGEDALLASQVLLKMSGDTVEVPAGTGYSVPKEAKKEEK